VTACSRTSSLPLRGRSSSRAAAVVSERIHQRTPPDVRSGERPSLSSRADRDLGADRLRLRISAPDLECRPSADGHRRSGLRGSPSCERRTVGSVGNGFHRRAGHRKGDAAVQNVVAARRLPRSGSEGPPIRKLTGEGRPDLKARLPPSALSAGRGRVQRRALRQKDRRDLVDPPGDARNRTSARPPSRGILRADGPRLVVVPRRSLLRLDRDFRFDPSRRSEDR
jgi:hypothetical protein